MNKELSIGTDTVGETDVLSVSATDADENVVVDVKHLTVDPENVTRFREQLHSESQSKETGNASTAEGETKRNASEKPVSKHSAPNERTFFGNNDRHSPPFVAAHTTPHPYGGNDTVSINASATKPTETARQNVPETSKPLSKTDNTASTAEPLSKIKTREHPHSPESASDMHKTAVWETIPFLRTTVETTTPVQESTATQASKSHAMLIAQQIRDHIIDRILVSSSAPNDNRTVTVQLSPRLLQDTEVQFTQNGTSLDIRLVSQNKDSVQFLQQHQSDLQTYLQGELKTYRAISVRVPSSQASAELAQPHDGRSRNRFEYQSTDEEETT